MYILCTAATRAEKNGSMKEWWNDAGQGGGWRLEENNRDDADKNI